MKKTAIVNKFSWYLKSSKSLKFFLNLSSLSSSKKRNLRKLICPGLRTPGFIFLPIDHGFEHGPSDFISNPKSVDPEYVLGLAAEARLSGVVMHIGVAQKYWQKKNYKNRVNLVLKLNGKSYFGDETTAFSPLISSVEEAVKLGASGVGYTLYLGSLREAEDLSQFYKVRKEAEEFGLPLILWSYPRGSLVEKSTEKNSWAAVAYAARVANEIGADLVKLNLPLKLEKTYLKDNPFYRYESIKQISFLEKLLWVREAAGAVGALVSGGKYKNEVEFMDDVRLSVKAGFDGFMLGRNIWQRSFDDSLQLIQKIKEAMNAGK
jgi:class I fructose-bisphosphate aldolase